MPVIYNFGQNIAIGPAGVWKPASVEEVLALLERYARSTTPVRCRGALHSWSPIIDTQGLLLDLRRLDHVQYLPGVQPRVRVGAGCTLGRLLCELRYYGVTLPTLGAIKKQTVAGAVATGTHGTGAPSLSSFVESVKLAFVDAEGRADTRTLDWRSGDEFLAARCALGTLGVVLELEFTVVPLYRVKESVRKYATLQGALAGWRDRTWPLTQFALIPWSWIFLVYRRKVSAADSLWLRLQAPVRRLWAWLSNDIVLHLLLLALLLYAYLRGDDGIVRRFFKKRLPKLIMAGPRRVDDSEAILTLRHDYFRHVEMEVFIPETEITEAVRKMREVVLIAGGQRGEGGVDFRGAGAEVEGLRGVYTHHYPLFFRRIEIDQTLVSMASAGDAGCDWISVSFFSYRGATAEYDRFCGVVASCLMAQHGARLHWGKFLPSGISLQRLRETYPRYGDFERIRARYDPTGMFRYERA